VEFDQTKRGFNNRHHAEAEMGLPCRALADSDKGWELQREKFQLGIRKDFLPIIDALCRSGLTKMVYASLQWQFFSGR